MLTEREAWIEIGKAFDGSKVPLDWDDMENAGICGCAKALWDEGKIGDYTYLEIYYKCKVYIDIRNRREDNYAWPPGEDYRHFRAQICQIEANRCKE